LCKQKKKVGRKGKYKRRKEVEKNQKKLCTKIKVQKECPKEKKIQNGNLLRKRKRKRRKRKEENPKREFVLE
jgi:hypothetical protein